MARKKISELPLDNAVIGTDVVPIVSDGATKRVQLSTLGTYFATIGGQPDAHASTHGAAGSDPVTIAASQLSGGSLPADAALAFSDATYNTSIAGAGVTVELTADPDIYSAVDPGSLSAHNGAGYASLNPSSVYFSNGTSLAVGTFDNAHSGANGISLVCAVGYELNWQAGYLRAVNGNGTTRNIWVESPLEFPGAGTDNVQIDATGITFADGSTQTTAATSYSLPTATASVLGGVKIGSGVTITDGVISVSTDYAAASDFDQGVKTTDSPRFVRLGLSDPDDEVSEWYVEAIGGVFSIGTRTIGAATGDVWFSVDSSGELLSSTIDWADVTNKPTLFDGVYSSLTSVPSTFAPSAHKTSHATGGSDALTASDIGAAAASHAHAWSDITSGVPSTFTPSAHNQAWSTITSTPTTLSGYGITDAVASNDARLTDARTPTSHAHGNITNAGAIGSTSGLVVTTGASGVLGALAQGTAGQVLKVNSGATGVEWGAAAADVSIDTTAADILSASSGSITADDPGADRLVFWDDSAGKLTHLTVSTGLSISGTTMTASVSASDISAGTLAYARMADPTVTSPSQITSNQNDYASFARGINRFTTNAARDITGMVAGSDGEVRVLCNVGTTAANTLTIKDESTSSTAGNRFSVPWNGDCVIQAEGSVVVFYDGTSSRWRVL